MEDREGSGVAVGHGILRAARPAEKREADARGDDGEAPEGLGTQGVRDPCSQTLQHRGLTSCQTARGARIVVNARLPKTVNDRFTGSSALRRSKA
jgi:hypothetical protein